MFQSTFELCHFHLTFENSKSIQSNLNYLSRMGVVPPTGPAGRLMAGATGSRAFSTPGVAAVDAPGASWCIVNVPFIALTSGEVMLSLRHHHFSMKTT